jgi:hypothetical protein
MDSDVGVTVTETDEVESPWPCVVEPPDELQPCIIIARIKRERTERNEFFIRDPLRLTPLWKIYCFVVQEFM